MIRRAPKVGYSTPEKRRYREVLYAGFKRVFGQSIGRRQLLLMPSAEGEEIEVALKAGFRIGNLHVVDKNPAIVAVLNRRYKNKLLTYGRPVDEAIALIAERNIPLDAVNLDLCAPIGDTWHTYLRKCFGELFFPCAVAVTVQRGRETGECAKVISEVAQMESNPGTLPWLNGRYYGVSPFGPQDTIRVCSLLPFEGGGPIGALNDTYQSLQRWGIYRGGKVSMLWGLFWLTIPKRRIA